VKSYLDPEQLERERRSLLRPHLLAV